MTLKMLQRLAQWAVSALINSSYWIQTTSDRLLCPFAKDLSVCVLCGWSGTREGLSDIPINSAFDTYHSLTQGTLVSSPQMSEGTNSPLALSQQHQQLHHHPPRLRARSISSFEQQSQHIIHQRMQAAIAAAQGTETLNSSAPVLLTATTASSGTGTLPQRVLSGSNLASASEPSPRTGKSWRNVVDFFAENTKKPMTALSSAQSPVETGTQYNTFASLSFLIECALSPSLESFIEEGNRV